jgi:branched-subunit amino acid transport protein
VSADLVGLAALMALATYPWRAVPLLAPGVDRLPRRVLDYLRLVGPAMLAALAAESVMVVLDADRHPSFHVGIEWLAVALCVAVVWRWRNLLLGLVLAAALVAIARATGIAPLA